MWCLEGDFMCLIVIVIGWERNILSSIFIMLIDCDLLTLSIFAYWILEHNKVMSMYRIPKESENLTNFKKIHKSEKNQKLLKNQKNSENFQKLREIFKKSKRFWKIREKSKKTQKNLKNLKRFKNLKISFSRPKTWLILG